MAQTDLGQNIPHGFLAIRVLNAGTLCRACLSVGAVLAPEPRRPRPP